MFFLLASISTLLIISCTQNFTKVYPVVILDSNLEMNYSNYSQVNSVNRTVLKLKKMRPYYQFILVNHL